MSFDASRPFSSPDDASSPPKRSPDYYQDASIPLGVPRAVSTASAPSAPRIRRRNRMITSCLECRRRKLKCDKSQPCANCTKFARDCVFLAPALDTASQLKLTEIKEKMGSLERVLEQDVARNGAWRDARRAQMAGPEDEIDFAPIPEDERDLEPSPLAVGDAVYDKADDDVEDELVDLGVAMGKMRLTDRIGGFFRPKMTEEMTVTLGKDTRGSMSPSSQSAGIPRPQNFMAPGPTYLPPASNFFFAPDRRGHQLVLFLPTRQAADHLIRQYWTAVHPICRIVHRPSFERRYELFWNDIRLGIEPVGSLQALVFAAMFSGVVSMPDDALYRDFAVPKKEILESFQQGAESALSRAQVLRTTKTETMQAFVMYLIPLCRDQMSRAHSALVGTAIRLAECMGLHKDGTAYGIAPTEVHVRRMIWYELAMLDIRTCEAQGPRPGIREGEFDTKFPLNIDDIDLESASPPTKDAERWTDMTVTLIRMRCNEMHRTIWFDRPRLEKKQISLTAVLGKIENFKRIMHEKYVPLIAAGAEPIHHFTSLMLTIVITRMYVMVLHRYHNSVSAKIPERLRSIIRASGTDCIEAAMALETVPQLSPWRWYAGALQQYHTAFLLMADVHQYPNSPEADRIWRVLDYVFEQPAPEMPRDQKALLLLGEIRDRLGVYHAARKSKAPVAMMRRLGENTGVGVASGVGPPGEEMGEKVEKELLFVGGPGGEKTRSETISQSSPREELGLGVSPEAMAGVDDLADIDWNEWDRLYPPVDVITGAELSAGILAPEQNDLGQVGGVGMGAMTGMGMMGGDGGVGGNGMGGGGTGGPGMDAYADNGNGGYR